MEKLTKTEIKWTVDALQLTIDYYEQVMRGEPGKRKKQAGACSFQRMQADCG